MVAESGYAMDTEDVELGQEHPRLQTPFYEQLRKKYPKAFMRRTSLGSDTSSMVSLPAYRPNLSLRCEAVKSDAYSTSGIPAYRYTERDQTPTPRQTHTERGEMNGSITPTENSLSPRGDQFNSSCDNVTPRGDITPRWSGSVKPKGGPSTSRRPPGLPPKPPLSNHPQTLPKPVSEHNGVIENGKLSQSSGFTDKTPSQSPHLMHRNSNQSHGLKPGIYQQRPRLLNGNATGLTHSQMETLTAILNKNDKVHKNLKRQYSRESLNSVATDVSDGNISIKDRLRKNQDSLRHLLSADFSLFKSKKKGANITNTATDRKIPSKLSPNQAKLTKLNLQNFQSKQADHSQSNVKKAKDSSDQKTGHIYSQNAKDKKLPLKIDIDNVDNLDGNSNHIIPQHMYVNSMLNGHAPQITRRGRGDTSIGNEQRNKRFSSPDSQNDSAVDVDTASLHSSPSSDTQTVINTTLSKYKQMSELSREKNLPVKAPPRRSRTPKLGKHKQESGTSQDASNLNLPLFVNHSKGE